MSAEGIMPGNTKATALKLLASSELREVLTAAELADARELRGCIRAHDFSEDDMMEVDLDDLPKVVFDKLNARWKTLRDTRRNHLMVLSERVRHFFLERGPAADVRQSVHNLFAEALRPGSIPDTTKRSATRPLQASDLQHNNLGDYMTWVGREEAQARANNIITKIYGHWCNTRIDPKKPYVYDGGHLEDRWKRGIMRTGDASAIIGQPGIGKTSMAETMLIDAANQVQYTELKAMLQRCIEHRLQYRIDMSEHGRISEEEYGGWIQTPQALALRVLYIMCAKSQVMSYRAFIKTLMHHPQVDDVARLLARLQIRDVVAVAKDTLLADVDGPFAFHFILDNVDTVMETEKQAREAYDSHFEWFRSLLHDGARDLQLEEDLVLITCCGTSMRLQPTDSVPGYENTDYLYLRLLSHEESLQVCKDLQCKLLAQNSELSAVLEALAKWAYGNPLHLCWYLMAAAQWINGQPANFINPDTEMLCQGLQQILGTNCTPAIDVQAIQNMVQNHVIAVPNETGVSIEEWTRYQDGALIKLLLAYAILERPVYPEYVLRGGHTYEQVIGISEGKTNVTFEMLEGCSVLALEPCERYNYTVVLSPVACKLYYELAKANNWLPEESYLMNALGKYLDPNQDQNELLSDFILKIWAMRYLDGPGPCQMNTLLHGLYRTAKITIEDRDFHTKVMLPTNAQLNTCLDLGHWDGTELLDKHVETVEAGGSFAFRGSHDTNLSEWWVLMKTAESKCRMVLFHGQLMSHQDSVTEQEEQTAPEESQKRPQLARSLVTVHGVLADGTLAKGKTPAATSVVSNCRIDKETCVLFGKRMDSHDAAAKRLKKSPEAFFHFWFT